MTYTISQVVVLVVLVFALCSTVYGTIITIQTERNRIKSMIYISSRDILKVVSMHIQFSRNKPEHYDSMDDYLQYIFDKSIVEITNVWDIHGHKKHVRRCIMDVININMDQIMVQANRASVKSGYDNVIPIRR